MALKRMPMPSRVEILDEGLRLAVTWMDGERTELEARTLRIRCPCAGCVDEMTGRRTLDPDRIPEGVRLVESRQVGRYALQFRWDDGHDTGIFTFERLRAGVPE